MSPHAPESVAPTRIDPVAASASELIGGPLGRYAALAVRGGRPAWRPAAAVLAGLASLTVALGVVQKGHCLTRGWSSPDQFWHACYSDLPSSAGIGHAIPYLPGAAHLDQPVISGLVMWLIGLLVPDGSAIVRAQWYFALWAVLITVIVMVLVVVTAAAVPRAPWRAAQVALSPVLVLAALVSVDLLGVLLASMALLAWGRRRIMLAGVLLGLAISARSYPLVLLVAIGLLAVRSGRALYAGISNYPAEATREAARILRALGTPCLIHQPRFNMLQREPLEQGVFDAAAHEGMGVIVFSPLAQGMLTDKYLDGVPPGSRATSGRWFDKGKLTPEFVSRLRKLNGIAKERGQTLAQMAIAWNLSHAAVTWCLIGASRPEQIDDCAAAVGSLAFSPAELASIAALI